MVHGTLPLFSRPVYRHSVPSSVSCSLVHLVLSLFFVVDFSRTLSLRSFLPCFTNHRFSMRSLSLSLSVTVTPSHSCGCRFSLAHTLPPEYYVLTERSQCPYPSLSLVHHPPPGTITELSRSVYCRCCPPLPPPTFPPTIALSPSDSVSLHLSTKFVLSLPIRSILSLFLTIRFLSAPYRAFQ